MHDRLLTAMWVTVDVARRPARLLLPQLLKLLLSSLLTAPQDLSLIIASIMVATTVSTAPYILLLDEICEDPNVFRENAREILNKFKSDSPDEVIQSTASILSSILRQDPFKFQSLVNLIHAKIIKRTQCNWQLERPSSSTGNVIPVVVKNVS
jgi:hypothetical protein